MLNVIPKVGGIKKEIELLKRRTRDQSVVGNPLFESFSKHVLCFMRGVVGTAASNKLHNSPDMGLKLANNFFGVFFYVVDYMLDCVDCTICKFFKRWVKKG